MLFSPHGRPPAARRTRNVRRVAARAGASPLAARGGHLTPVALWTGRLPGLRPLPRKRTLWLVGGIALGGIAGAFGALGPNGPYLAALASLAVGWTAFRHRWPTELPLRLRSIETPQGPDEKAVAVEFRHEGDLLGWDVGLLWFEKGGVGFVGRTVSFVVPRAIMAPPHPIGALTQVLRGPQLTAKVFETTVGIVPLDREMRAEMTLARIESLPDAITSETILPPSSMHPELLQRGQIVRRRLPILVALGVANAALTLSPGQIAGTPRALPHLVAASIGLCAFLYVVLLAAPLPRSIRERLPK